MNNPQNHSTLALLGLLVACGGGATPLVDAVADPDATVDTAVDAPVEPESGNQVDLLFVIGDAPSMQLHQQAVVANIDNIVAALAATPNGLPNLHVGVVSTDVGTKGTDDLEPGAPIGSGPGACADEGKAGLFQGSSAVGGNFLVDVKNTDGSRTQNYTGTLTEALADMIDLGTNGCAFQQPLEAMKRALTPNPTNQGFLRPTARLAVVFILAEDDCSLAHSTLLGPEGGLLGPLRSFRCIRFGVTCDVGGATDAAMNQVGVKDQCHPNDASPHLALVSSYADFLKAQSSDVVVAAIVGTNDPFAVEVRMVGGELQPFLASSCLFEGDDGVINTADDRRADPAIRLSSFLSQFPDRATQVSLCQADLSGAFAALVLP